MGERNLSIDWESDKVLSRIYELAIEGATLKEIAINLECGLSTLKSHQSKDKTVGDAIKKGRELCSTRLLPKMETALKKVMCGFHHTETKEKRGYLFNPDGTPLLDEDGKKMFDTTEIITTKKYVVPNTTALIFGLVNKSPRYKSINKVEGMDKLADALFKLSSKNDTGD